MNLQNPLVLSAICGLLIFIVSYHWSDKILGFILKYTVGSQEEILEIMEKLFIRQEKEITIRNCWILSIAFGTLGFFIIWPNVIFSFIFFIFFLIGTWIIIRKVLRALWEAHCDKVVFQLVDVLTIMCNSIKVGLGVAQALERITRSFSGPIAKEFQLVLNKIQLGQNLEESLGEMGDRIQRPDVDMLVTAINILKETGGNLGETFFIMAETMRERQKMAKKIKALTAQGMMQAKIMSAIPFFLIGVFYVMDKSYISPLLFKPLGWVFLFIVCVLVFIGWTTMKKMVEIKV